MMMMTRIVGEEVRGSSVHQRLGKRAMMQAGGERGRHRVSLGGGRLG